MFNNEDGQALVLVALLMVVLMGFAALVIDVGMMHLTKSQMQNAADAAALAGAQDLPTAGTATSVAKDIAEKNGAEKAKTTVTTPYKGDSNKIEVVCTKNVQYSFARVLGFTDADVSARAVAEKNPSWAGEGLPFINLDFDYSTTDPIAWTKVGPGIKGTIMDFYTKGTGLNVYFEVDYKNGITMKNGFANGEKGLDGSKLKDGLNIVLTKADVNVKKVYLFSLRADIIKSGIFTVNGGNKVSVKGAGGYSDPKNGDVIDPGQLVLIEGVFNGCDNWNNQHEIYLTYTGNVFDLGNNITPDKPDFPTEHLSTMGASSKLVE